MDSYKTDDEQLEQVKQWLRENGLSLVLGISIALATVFGWRYWQDHQRIQQETASLNYQGLLDAVYQLDQADEAAPNMLATARTLADTLKNDFSDFGYASLAALIKARLAIEEGDTGQAETELRWVLEQKPAPELAALARLRLAKVLLAKGEPDAALQQLQDPGSYAFAYEHVRGDILLAQGDTDGARAAYEKSQQLGRDLEQAVDDPLLVLKLRDLRTAATTDQAES